MNKILNYLDSLVDKAVCKLFYSTLWSNDYEEDCLTRLSAQTKKLTELNDKLVNEYNSHKSMKATIGDIAFRNSLVKEELRWIDANK